MNSKVIKLADLNQYEINPEYRNIDVSDEEIENLIKGLASNLGETVEVASIEENCAVVCTSTEGRSVLLYPSLQIDGAIQAAKDVEDKSVGDIFTTVIRDEEISLEVKKILVNHPLDIDDKLAKACEIDGVDNLNQLKAHLKESEIDKIKEKKVRMIFSEYMQYLIDESEVEIDEAEANAWAIPEAKRVYDEELSFGIDLRFTEEGDMLSLDEALDRLAMELQIQFKVNLIQEKFGAENGFVPSEEEGLTYDSYMFETLTAKAREALS